MSKIKSATLCIVHCALCIGAAMATPSVTIDSVAQRWPWNNKVDITYTISGGTDMSAHEYYKIKFKATVNGREYVIDGSRDIIATTLDGTHTVTWTNAPAGVKATGCTMGATMYATTGDYMIVDLDTGHMALEDMEAGDTYTAKPTAANARYNTALYKTDRLVLRRVPRTADSAYPTGYPTGYADYMAPTYTGAYTNSVTRWNTAKDYYVGVFKMTIGQYQKVMATVPACAAFVSGGNNVKDWCPVGAPSYNTLRNSKVASDTLGSNATSDSIFERLNAMTGVGCGFDLPTEVMWEIAHRAGTTTMYFWYNSYRYADVVKYVHCNDTRRKSSDVSGEVVKTQMFRVGAYTSNPWGLYDTLGNLCETCRDVGGYGDLADAPDAFTPKYDSAATKPMDRGTYWENGAESVRHKSSYRSLSNLGIASSYGQQHGFRVFFVAP